MCCVVSWLNFFQVRVTFKEKDNQISYLTKQLRSMEAAARSARRLLQLRLEDLTQLPRKHAALADNIDPDHETNTSTRLPIKEEHLKDQRPMDMDSQETTNDPHSVASAKPIDQGPTMISQSYTWQESQPHTIQALQDPEDDPLADTLALNPVTGTFEQGPLYGTAEVEGSDAAGSSSLDTDTSSILSSLDPLDVSEHE